MCSHWVLQFAILFVYGNSSGWLWTQPGCPVRPKGIPAVHALDPTVVLRPLKALSDGYRRSWRSTSLPRWALAGEGTPAQLWLQAGLLLVCLFTQATPATLGKGRHGPQHSCHLSLANSGAENSSWKSPSIPHQHILRKQALISAETCLSLHV